MGQRRPKPHPSSRQLLWHGLMGMTLGVIFAGLLLDIEASHPGALINYPDTPLARLAFVFVVACLFGIGATLTGARFLANGKS